MSFFYDLNKRMADLAKKQDLNESKVAESEKWIQKAINPKHKGDLHKALHVAQDKKIPKAKIEKATHSKNPKLRHMAQFAKNVANEDQEVEESGLQAYLGNKKYGKEGMDALRKAGREHVGKEKMAKIRAKYDKMDEEIADEGNAFTGALAKTPKGGKFKLGDKTFKDTSSIEEGHCPACDCSPCKCNEGNAFTAALKATPKGGKFKVGGKEFTDTSSIEEGFKEMDAWLAQREKEKGTGKFDRKERTLPGGMKATTYTRKQEDEPEDDEEVTTITIKKKGRPKGTGRKLGAKHSGRSKLASKDAIAEEVPLADRGEYNDEAGMAKDSLHTIVRHARELEQALHSNENLPEWVQEKIGQIKGMMSSVTDYILSTHERDVEHETGKEGITLVPEKAVSKNQAVAARIARGVQKGEVKAKPGSASAEMAKMAPKELKKFAKTPTKGLPKHVEEESTDKEDQKAEKAGKKVAKDIEYDEGHKGKDDNRAERAGKRVTKDIEYDDKKDRKEKKEEKVDETTVAGSIATATTSGKSSKGGIAFGKGVYEGFNNSVEQMITESIAVESKMEECGMGDGQSITIQADGEDATKLMALLKLAGLEGCPTCGKMPCGCNELEENKPDWPTNTETLDSDTNLRTYSGGLNGPKSTGQTTVPVVASQLRRQVSMEESVELERTLFKTWKNYKG